MALSIGRWSVLPVKRQVVPSLVRHGFSHASRPVPGFYGRSLSGSIRLNSGINSYFQNDTTRHRPSSGAQAASGDFAGPIYVLPAESGSRGGRARATSLVLLGFLVGATLLEAVFLIMYWPEVSDYMEFKRWERQYEHSDASDESQPGQYNESNSPYVEHDGTELQRNPNVEGTELPPAELLALEKDVVLQKLWNLREVSEKADETAEMRTLLDSANEAQLKVHKALIDIVTISSSETAILDNALLESRPITLSDQTSLDPSKASLIRVVDNEGKNKIIMLGVDMDWHESNLAAASRFPADCYEIDRWLVELADELERAGANARGMAIYLYSNRVILDIDHISGGAWMTRYRQSDFPAGFPLSQMRRVKKISEPSSNLSNLSSKLGATDPGR